MVKVAKFVTTKYLAAKNAGEYKGKKFTIDAVFAETINDVEKLVVRLSGIDQALPLNQTNLTILVDAFGDDSDKWINHSVVLNVVKVTFNGELKDGIQLTPQ